MAFVLPSSPVTGRSRAVRRPVPAGSAILCPRCGTVVKFVARAGKHQVIANVYVDGRWDRVEHFHPDCYADAGEPHGPVTEMPPPLRRR